MFITQEVMNMPKTATNLSIDSDIKQQSIELFADLGMDLRSCSKIT